MRAPLTAIVIGEGGTGLEDALRALHLAGPEKQGFNFFRQAAAAELGLEPHILFIDAPAVDPDHVMQLGRDFPAAVILAAGTRGMGEDLRRQYRQAGADEVMTLADLESDAGRRLLARLFDIRRLNDAGRIVARSEERFRGVIEHAHEIILLLEEDGTVVYASPAFARQTGFEEWEILGQTFDTFIHADDRGQAAASLAAVRGAPPSEVHALEYRFSVKSGAWRSFDANVTNLLADDTVHAIVVNMRDMTEQRAAEAELEEYREHLETLVGRRTRELVEVQARANTVIDASPDALLAMDNDGQILFISQHYKESYPKSAGWLVPGRNAMEAFARVANEIGIMADDPRYKVMLDWWANPAGTTEFQMNNGTWLRLRARKMQDGRGTVVSTTNITDLKRQQALLAEQSAELEAALQTERGIVEQQKTFVSMVSHEFRTPLTIIDGNAQIIQNRADRLEPAALERRATTIRGAVDRLVRLIESILSAHMMDSGRLSVTPADCDLSLILQAAIADQQDITPGHKIVSDFDNLPPAMQLDAAVIRQVMTNLLSNAVKYSPGCDRVEVRAACAGPEVLITVRDWGVGIPAKELPKISTKYFRASTSGGIPGTGLGLNLVRQFVELHGGQMSIDSAEGAGTTVSLRLPLQAGG